MGNRKGNTDDLIEHDDSNHTPIIYRNDLFDPLQDVLDYLRDNDLQTLSGVSRRLREYVEVFCEAKYKSLKAAVGEDFEERFKRTLLIDREVDWLKELCRENSDGSSFKKLYFCLKRLSPIQQRLPVSSCYVCWLGDTRYIVKVFDRLLNREIVHLQTVCWLDIKHTFPKTKPGSYVTSMRMNIHDGDWPIYADNGTTLYTQWEDMDGFHEIATEMDSERFQKLRSSLPKKLKSRRDVIKLGNASVTDYVANGDWFNFSLGPFYVASTCDIKFGLKDCNGSWKSGMKWDYIELKSADDYHKYTVFFL